MTIKSVYNFIPAPEEKEVFKPNWANEVSHDIPFEDGESGEIELKITAQTPIFIRNGHSKDKPTNEFSHFVKADGSKEYFIPATSLKGMIRNVMEIMSFSRLNPDLVDDNRYSYRDLKTGSQYLNDYDTNNVKAGWLEQNVNGDWTIEECNELIHVHHSDVDELLNGKYKNGFNGFRQAFLNRNPKEKTAKWKYDQLKSLDSLDVYYGNKDGRLVFTGQSSKRNEQQGRRPSGKVHEFFFSKETGNTHSIDEKIQKDFRFIYLEHDSNNISPDWKYWKKELDKGGRVPVFFNKSNTGVKHFGLAYMYKLPYEKSIHEIQPLKSYKGKEGADLATCMFGSLENPKSLIKDTQSVKGRVMFGHAISKNAAPFSKDDIQKEILAGPKASFYPFYLQNGDYNHKNARLGGYKKYPAHLSHKKGDYSKKQKENKNVFSEFIPLKKDSVFTSKVRFHNLKKIEIGALISAITFHNNPNTYSHTIGGAKPFGYGKVKIEVTGMKYLDFELKDYLYAFEHELNSHLNGKWVNRDAVSMLLAMSKTNVPDEINQQYVYPTMNQEQRINEFVSGVNLPTYKVERINSIVDVVDEQAHIITEEAYLSVKDADDVEILQQFLDTHKDNAYAREIEDRINTINETAEYKRLLISDNIEELESFVQECKNEDFKRAINERAVKLRRENKAKRAQDTASNALNIETKTYNAILAKMREFSNLNLTYNDEQRKELLNDIVLSFNDEDSAKKYSKGYNKKEKRLDGAWKEFKKNGLTFKEITELYNRFKETNG